MKLLKMSEITLDDLEAALTSNNIEPGSMTVRDGYYEYNIKFSTLLRTPEDVENIYIRKNNHIFQLKDLARISVVPEKETGASLSNGKRAVTLAVIKQADENMDNMKEALAEVTDYFASVYPDIDFSISRNQTELLDYTISKPVVGFPFHLYRRHPFLRGYQEPGSDRVKYGGEPDHQFPFFLPLQDVAEYHLHLRADPGFGYDDRQFDHRNGKHYPIQDTRILAGRGLQ